MSEFEARYARYSNEKLLQVIENPGDYKSEAVREAQAVLASRQLSEQDMLRARMELGQQLHKRKVTALGASDQWEGKLKHVAVAALRAMDIRRPTVWTADKSIAVVCVYFAVSFLSVVLSQVIYLVRYPVNLPYADLWPYFLNPLFTLIISLPLYKRLTVGWVLAVAYFAFNVVLALVAFARNLITEIRYIDDVFSYDYAVLLQAVVNIPVFCGCIIILSLKSVRASYGINKDTMYVAIGLGVFAGLGFWLAALKMAG